MYVRVPTCTVVLQCIHVCTCTTCTYTCTYTYLYNSVTVYTCMYMYYMYIHMYLHVPVQQCYSVYMYVHVLHVPTCTCTTVLQCRLVQHVCHSTACPDPPSPHSGWCRAGRMCGSPCSQQYGVVLQPRLTQVREDSHVHSTLAIYMYMQVHVHVQLIHVHLHVRVHNSILLLFPFLRLSLLSLFPFLSLMLVCYTHIFHVCCRLHYTCTKMALDTTFIGHSGAQP